MAKTSTDRSLTNQIPRVMLGISLMSGSAFLSCDWGTSHLRLRLVETNSLTVLAEQKTQEGVATIAQGSTPRNRPEKFAEVLLRGARELCEKTGIRTTKAVISGMASSSMGWKELPYAPAPLPLSADAFLTETLSLPELTVVLVSGVRGSDDVMRGEECEALGLSMLVPDLAHSPVCLVLPGTHSKHIRLEGGMLVDFTTYMTGEVYAQLQSTPTLQAALRARDGFSEPEFLAGVRETQRSGLLAALFKIRARVQLGVPQDLHGLSFLSGALIGSELLSLAPKLPAVLACSAPMDTLYIRAASALEISLQKIAPEILANAVLCAHRALLPG